MLNLIFYYIFSTSLILYYGVGLNRVLTLKKDLKSLLKSFLKALIITVSVTAICWTISHFILIPLEVNELYAFITSFFFVIIAFTVHHFLRAGNFDLGEDFILPFMIILVSLNEGHSIIAAILISVSSVFAFYLVLLIVFSLRRRFKLYSKDEGITPVNIILASIAVIFIALYCWNASWLMLGIN